MEIQTEIERNNWLNESLSYRRSIEGINWLKEALSHRFLLIQGESGSGKSQLAYFLGEMRQPFLNHQLKIINCRTNPPENWNPKSTEATTWILDEVDIDLLGSEAMLNNFIYPVRNLMDSFILVGQFPTFFNSKKSFAMAYSRFMNINLQRNLNGRSLPPTGIINQDRVIQLESWMQPTVISED